jgi:hypothetical protein
MVGLDYNLQLPHEQFYKRKFYSNAKREQSQSLLACLWSWINIGKTCSEHATRGLTKSYHTKINIRPTNKFTEKGDAKRK